MSLYHIRPVITDMCTMEPRGQTNSLHGQTIVKETMMVVALIWTNVKIAKNETPYGR